MRFVIESQKEVELLLNSWNALTHFLDKTFMTYPLGLKLKQVVCLYSKKKHVKSMSCVWVALKVISLIHKINDFPNSQSISNIKWTFLLVDHGKGTNNVQAGEQVKISGENMLRVTTTRFPLIPPHSRCVTYSQAWASSKCSFYW